jgi:rhodanese-related sulfurtransferase
MDLPQEKWAKQLVSDPAAVILDVRSEEEVEEGFIPNAKNIDIREGQGFIDKLHALDKTKSYYVYCRSGARSAQACAIMHQLGFSSAFNLLGGFMEWEGDTTE